MNTERLWGGRFKTLPSKKAIDFLSGRDVKGIPPADEVLIPYEIWGSRAHVIMLGRNRILSREDCKRLLKGLRELEKLYEKGRFQLEPYREDVHSNIEGFLIERVGIEYGGKIHTGRSRNDQIVLDIRLYLRDKALGFVEGLNELIESFLEKAEEYKYTIMPGYTHHQHAVGTTFGHLLLSFAEAFSRDVQRFIHWYNLFNKNPLGAAAGYGTSFNLDRVLTSKLLGFDGPTENVTDHLTQRWEPEAELAHAIAMMMNHLSTVAQTLILLSTQEFGMIHLDDRHCTGSSIMPQKKNPCSLEVIKAKTSFSHGVMVSLLSIGKSLFMGYNRDTQWTKYWIMDLVEDTRPALSVMADVIRLLQVNKSQMLEQAQKGFLGATLLMEWMVRSFGLPLRKAKMVMEKAVKYSEEEGLEEVSYQGLMKALKNFNLNIVISDEDIKKYQRPERILYELPSIGTPSEKRMEENLLSLRNRLELDRDWLSRKRSDIENAKKLVLKMEKRLIG